MKKILFWLLVAMLAAVIFFVYNKHHSYNPSILNKGEQSLRTITNWVTERQST